MKVFQQNIWMQYDIDSISIGNDYLLPDIDKCTNLSPFEFLLYKRQVKPTKLF